ncbi:MAG: hypothetical protein WAM60_26490 [Candidatus Promineifilaceae bacterium]
MSNDFNKYLHSNSYGYTEDEVHDENTGDTNITYLGSNTASFYKSVNQNGHQAKSQEKFERLYRSVYIAIERRPEDPKVSRSELVFITEKIYREVITGDPASFSQIGRLLKQLDALAPDVFQVCITVLTNPNSDLSPQLVAMVQEIKDGCEPTSQINMPLTSYLEKELTTHQLPPDQSNQMRSDLTQLQTAVDSGNVQPVRQLLVDLTSALPGLRQPLRTWLVDSTEVPTAIKVFARNYLDRA